MRIIFSNKQLTSVQESVFCKPGECVDDGSDNNTIRCVKCKKLITVFYLHDEMISPAVSTNNGIVSERKRHILTEKMEHDTPELRVSVDSIDFSRNLAQTYPQLKCSKDSDTLQNYLAISHGNKAPSLLNEAIKKATLNSLKEKMGNLIPLKSEILAGLVDASFNAVDLLLPPFTIPDTIPVVLIEDLFTARLVIFFIISFMIVCLFLLALTFCFISTLTNYLLGKFLFIYFKDHYFKSEFDFSLV
jgi:hypothetical protein